MQLSRRLMLDSIISVIIRATEEHQYRQHRRCIKIASSQWHRHPSKVRCYSRFHCADMWGVVMPQLFQAYEDCSSAVDNSAQRIVVALLNCLGEKCTEPRLSSAARTASAFVIMKILYHLQGIRFSLDEVHAAAVEVSKGTSCGLKSFALPLRRRK